MNKTLIIIGIITALVVQVSAVGFSPSSLIFELEQGRQECKMITITSDSETISVSDKWAENKDAEWKVSLFETDASAHGISISYDNELSINERQVEVCLSGQNIGEYHGVLLLTEEQQGNSIVQMGIWLKVIITEPQQTAPASAGAGSSGGGGGYVPIKNTTSVKNQTNNSATTSLAATSLKSDVNNGELTQENNKEANPNENNPGITGAIIGGIGNPKIIGIFIAIIVVAGIIIYNKNIREKLRIRREGV